MKKFFLITALSGLLFSSFVCYGSDKYSENRKRVPVIVTKTRRTPAIQRSVSSDISVYVCTGRKVVEIEGTGLTQADVYILDAAGNTIDFISAGYLDFLQIDLPAVAGTYMLIVSSYELYAEGFFEVNEQ